MSASARRWLTWGIAGIVAGAVLGLAIGWWLWPVRLASTSPAYLRRDFRDNYIVMVASAYEAEGDLDAARDRLALLEPTDPARPAVELAERLAQVGGSVQDIARLEHLVAALVAPPSTADPSAEGR